MKNSLRFLVLTTAALIQISCSHTSMKESAVKESARGPAAAEAPVCELKASPKEAGWTQVVQGETALTEYAADPAQTIRSLVGLKDNRTCPPDRLSCDVQVNPNGSESSAVFVKGVRVSGYNSREVSEDLLKGLQARKVCASHASRCKIIYRPDGSRHSAVGTEDGRELSAWDANIDKTIERWIKLKSEEVCPEYSFACEIHYDENKAGWTAVFGDDTALSDYEQDIGKTIARLNGFKERAVCR